MHILVWYILYGLYLIYIYVFVFVCVCVCARARECIATQTYKCSLNAFMIYAKYICHVFGSRIVIQDWYFHVLSRVNSSTEYVSLVNIIPC